MGLTRTRPAAGARDGARHTRHDRRTAPCGPSPETTDVDLGLGLALAGLAAGLAAAAAALRMLSRWALLDEGDRETWSM